MKMVFFKNLATALVISFFAVLHAFAAAAQDAEADLKRAGDLINATAEAERRGNLEEAFAYVNEAAEICHRYSHLPCSADTNFFYGSLLHRQGKLSEALEFYNRSYEYYTRARAPAELVVRTLDRIGDVSVTLHGVPRACEIWKEAYLIHMHMGSFKVYQRCDMTGWSEEYEARTKNNGG